MQSNKIKLIFYSGGQTDKNRLVHQALSDLVPQKKSKSMTYIPFCKDGANPYFYRLKRRYTRYGFNRFLQVPVDEDFSERDFTHALQSDVIYLAGGNTYYFLHHLMKKKLLARLKKYAMEGGVLAGLSAGGLIMTPHIELAGYPDFCSDDNEVGLKRFKGLGLVRFEFFPHFSQSKRFRNALLRYSKHSKFPVCALKDGSGLVVSSGNIKCLGSGFWFEKGKMARLK